MTAKNIIRGPNTPSYIFHWPLRTADADGRTADVPLSLCQSLDRDGLRIEIERADGRTDGRGRKIPFAESFPEKKALELAQPANISASAATGFFLLLLRIAEGKKVMAGDGQRERERRSEI